MRPRQAEFASAYGLARFCGRGRLVSAWFGLRAVWKCRRGPKFEAHHRKRVGM